MVLKNNDDSLCIDKKGIVSEVRRKFSDINNTKLGWNKIPDSVDVYVKDGILNTYFEKPSNNMYSNEGAFEAWITILKRWLKKEHTNRVIISWKSIEIPLEETILERLHYNRFLYRIYMFSRMYPDWFEVNENNQNEVLSLVSLIKHNKCILNEPLPIEKGTTEPKKTKIEHRIEELFMQDKYLFENRIGLSELYNQLPVGLFKCDKKKENAVFTGGKSALDLWGVNENKDVLFAFELKQNDKKVGIISELYFYLLILYEACCINNGIFGFDESMKNNENRGAYLLTGSKFKTLKGYFLVDNMHPLIDSKVIDFLNEGLSRVGNISVEVLKYDYDGNTVKWQN